MSRSTRKNPGQQALRRQVARQTDARRARDTSDRTAVQADRNVKAQARDDQDRMGPDMGTGGTM